jgi:hypothetical protein
VCPEQGVVAVAFGDELLVDDLQVAVVKRGPMSNSVAVAPTHRGGAAESVVVSAGPGVLAGGRQQPAASRSHWVMLRRRRRLPVERHVNQCIQAEAVSKDSSGRSSTVASARMKVASGITDRARSV